MIEEEKFSEISSRKSVNNGITEALSDRSVTSNQKNEWILKIPEVPKESAFFGSYNKI